jgi:hypothetical protein
MYQIYLNQWTAFNILSLLWVTYRRGFDLLTSTSVSCRSRWSIGLRRALSSLAWKPGPWVRIPLRAWMFSVCVCAFFCVCVQVEALRRADHPSKESYRLFLIKKLRKLSPMLQKREQRGRRRRRKLQRLNYSQHNAIANLHNLQFTINTGTRILSIQ